MTARPSDDDDLAGARGLVAALLKLALRDARSPWDARRTEARAFLADPEALGAWCDLAGLDTESVQRLVQAVLDASNDPSLGGL